MDDPYVAWRVEYDRKKAAERQENKRKFEAECLQEDRVTAAKRHKEDEQVKRHRKDKMVEFEPRITLTNALDLLGLSRETHPTMEDIYAGWTWRMVGLCATYSSSDSEVKRIMRARDALMHSTVKYLGLDVKCAKRKCTTTTMIQGIKDGAKERVRGHLLTPGGDKGGGQEVALRL